MNSSPIGLSRILRVLLAVLLLAVLSIWVPLMPYSPYCSGRHFIGPVFLAPGFRIQFTNKLRSRDVAFIHVDGLVLVRFWDWFADPDDRLINASNKAVSSLVDPAWGADFQRFRAASAS